jgi:hypothetical protein
MTECSAQLCLGFHPRLAVRLTFDAPEVCSDGGVVLLRQLDDRLGLTAGFARCLPDARDATRVVHDRPEQSRQRIYQIALGYEDCNDADRLRSDPLLKTVCDRTPDDPVGLSSQPTLSRFENAPDGLTLRRLVRWLERSYAEGLPADTEVVILDIDATDDETHGAQQLSFFHGFFDHHIYHPLMVYDGDSGQLISAILRPGNTHASRGAIGVLCRIIRRLKRRLPAVQIAVRGDAGFAMPRLMAALERLNEQHGGIDYLFGIAKNPRLRRLAEPEMLWAAELFERSPETVRRFTSFHYAARSWPRPRRIIAKAEHSERGPNPRFVVTTIEGFDPEMLYHAYIQRGLCEHWIKDFKCAVAADRLSCSRFTANCFRLLLHAAAYRLLHALRQQAACTSAELGRAQFDTLRLRLLKVAAIVRRSARCIWVRLPRVYPWQRAFAWLAAHLNSPPLPA